METKTRTLKLAQESRQTRNTQVEMIAMTRGALLTLNLDDVRTALDRYEACDWGEVSHLDAETNDDCLEHGLGIVAAYTDRNGSKFWIMLEDGSSMPTVMLPEEY